MDIWVAPPPDTAASTSPWRVLPVKSEMPLIVVPDESDDDAALEITAVAVAGSLAGGAGSQATKRKAREAASARTMVFFISSPMSVDSLGRRDQPILSRRHHRTGTKRFKCRQDWGF